MEEGFKPTCYWMGDHSSKHCTRHSIHCRRVKKESHSCKKWWS